MKRLIQIAFISIFLFLLHSMSYSQSSLVDLHGLLKTSGNKVVDKTGKSFSVSGNSLFWINWAPEFCNADVVNWLKTDWQSGIVRITNGIEPAGGYLDNPDLAKQRIIAVVDACIKAGVYVLIDWHEENAFNHTTQAVAFFQDMATRYGTYPNVMYEIFNEPLAVSWSNTIKPYALQVIKAIRAIDPDNMIVVGTPNYSQDVDVASYDRITGYDNIAYTLHFYIGMHAQALRDKATTALNNGIALFVTEWGFWVSPPDLNEFNAWRDFMKNNNLSNTNWSVYTKIEPSSILKTGASATGGWPLSQLTDPGLLVRDMVLNWYGGTVPNVCETYPIETKIPAAKWCTMFGVQTETTTDVGGGIDVGYINNGDWMTYRCNVSTTGTYTASYRVASLAGGGKLELKSGTTSLGTTNVPQTNGWQNWATISHDIQLSAGEQDITIAANTGGFNINWLQFERKIITGLEPNALLEHFSFGPNPFANTIAFTRLLPEEPLSIQVTDIFGNQVFSSALPQKTVEVGENWTRGIYFVKCSGPNARAFFKILKE